MGNPTREEIGDLLRRLVETAVDMKDRVKELEAERDALQAQLDETRNCLDSALHSVDVLERRAGEFRRQGNVAEQALATARADALRILGRAFDAITSGPFDASDERIQHIADHIDQLQSLLDHPAPAPAPTPVLTVWYGKMPESNGRENWTAIIGRKGDDIHLNGFCFARSEYPGRVLYEADRMRWIIGEREEKPRILEYDADTHNRYVTPAPTPSLDDVVVAALEWAAKQTTYMPKTCPIDPKEAQITALDFAEDRIRAAASDPATVAEIVKGSQK
jgi:hypothetical protein